MSVIDLENVLVSCKNGQVGREGLLIIARSVSTECELHTPPCRYMSNYPSLWDHITRLWVKSADELTRALARHHLRPM